MLGGYFVVSLFLCFCVFCEHTVSVHCCTCPRTVEMIPKTKSSLKLCMLSQSFQKRPQFWSKPQIRLARMAWLLLVLGCSQRQNAVLRLPGRNLLHCAAPNLYAITQGRSAGVKGTPAGSNGVNGDWRWWLVNSCFFQMGRWQTHSRLDVEVQRENKLQICWANSCPDSWKSPLWQVV